MDENLIFALAVAGVKGSKEANSRIDNLPKPMVYKGTLGTGGTITTLPTASSENIGDTYVVITAGTYASQSANIGDMFISTGTDWTYVPSGDIDIIDDSTTSATKVWSSNKVNTELGKKQNAFAIESDTLTAGETSITLSSEAITADSNIIILTSPEVLHNSISSTTGSVTITFDAQANDIGVKVVIF